MSSNVLHIPFYIVSILVIWGVALLVGVLSVDRQLSRKEVSHVRVGNR